jgi:hypothetical protein
LIRVGPRDPGNAIGSVGSLDGSEKKIRTESCADLLLRLRRRTYSSRSREAFSTTKRATVASLGWDLVPVRRLHNVNTLD